MDTLLVIVALGYGLYRVVEMLVELRQLLRSVSSLQAPVNVRVVNNPVRRSKRPRPDEDDEEEVDASENESASEESSEEYWSAARVDRMTKSDIVEQSDPPRLVFAHPWIVDAGCAASIAWAQRAVGESGPRVHLQLASALDLSGAPAVAQVITLRGLHRSASVPMEVVRAYLKHTAGIVLRVGKLVGCKALMNNFNARERKSLCKTPPTRLIALVPLNESSTVAAVLIPEAAGTAAAAPATAAPAAASPAPATAAAASASAAFVEEPDDDDI